MAWIAAGGAILGGLIASSGSRGAASTQADSADRATATQAQMFDKQVELQEPFRKTGLEANNRLAVLMRLRPGEGYGSLARNFTADDFTADPGYQFRLGEGMKGVENSAAARGSLLSFATLKALQRYGQDFASNEYSKSYDRFNTDTGTQFNRLAALGGGGQTATNALTSAAGNFGNSAAGNIMGAGNAAAAGMVGSANAWNSAIGQGISGYQQNELMKMLRRPSPSWNGYGTGMFAGASSGDVGF